MITSRGRRKSQKKEANGITPSGHSAEKRKNNAVITAGMTATCTFGVQRQKKQPSRPTTKSKSAPNGGGNSVGGRKKAKRKERSNTRRQEKKPENVPTRPYKKVEGKPRTDDTERTGHKKDQRTINTASARRPFLRELVQYE